MQKKILISAVLSTIANIAGAQTPAQATGSLQAAMPVAPVEKLAPALSISVEGLSPHTAGPLNSTAPDSGPQQWKDVMGWIGLQVGMTADEVLGLLGPDYRERVTAESTMWTYQDQKALLFGSVSFEGGKLDHWSSPRF